MYFNLITLTPGRERQALREGWDRPPQLKNPYREHQWLWQFFPAERESLRDFLFRREDANSLPRFYVVSERPAHSPSAAWKVQTREYRPQLEEGDCLRFTLRANPVVAVKRDKGEGKKTVRHDVVMHEKKRILAEKGLQRWRDLPINERPPLYELVRKTCSAWLEKRATENGFTVDCEDERFAVDAYQPLKLHPHVEDNKKHDQEDSRQNDPEKKPCREIYFSQVDFSGLLTVTDPERFQAALMQGIGPAKAFGCGLLLVRPL